jgi:hypothetical protein
MSSSVYTSHADVTAKQPAAGPGHSGAWLCALCGKPQFVQAGRRLRRVRGLRTWVCARCAK